MSFQGDEPWMARLLDRVRRYVPDAEMGVPVWESDLEPSRDQLMMFDGRIAAFTPTEVWLVRSIMNRPYAADRRFGRQTAHLAQDRTLIYYRLIVGDEEFWVHDNFIRPLSKYLRVKIEHYR